MEREILYRSSPFTKTEFRFETCSKKTKNIPAVNVSHKATNIQVISR